MHILHVTPYYAPAYAFGGVVRSAEGMTRALARRGHRVTVLTTDALNQTGGYTGPTDEMQDGVRVLRSRNLLPWLRGRLNLSTPRGLQQLAKAVLPDADVVHCHEFRTIENLLIAPLAADLRKPLVLSPHGTLARQTGRSMYKAAWDSLLSPRIAPYFEHVIGLTEAEARDAKALWPSLSGKQPAFSVIPNGVDLADYQHLPDPVRFRERYRLGDGPVCLFMARLHPRKGIDVLVRAFRQVDMSEARLLIVGPDEGMRAALEPLLDERMVLTGYLGGDERLAAFAAADLLALPAVGEGMPMVVLEAMAAGLPVIISPECYLPQVASAGAGLEVMPDINRLADALRTLLGDTERRRAMGAAARQLVREQFTWDAIAAQLEAVYQSLLSPVRTGE
jgi:glycosyltransferase involved in cell wall biosynthesis